MVWLTVEEACERLGVTRETVMVNCRRGHLVGRYEKATRGRPRLAAVTAESVEGYIEYKANICREAQRLGVQARRYGEAEAGHCEVCGLLEVDGACPMCEALEGKRYDFFRRNRVRPPWSVGDVAGEEGQE